MTVFQSSISTFVSDHFYLYENGNNIFPILLNTFASWHLCRGLCDVSRSEGLGNTEATATAVHPENAKHQSDVWGLRWGCTEGSGCNLGNSLASWDLETEVGGA